MTSVGVCILAVVVMTTASTACMRQIVSVEHVEKMINDQVPVGSDKQKVREFINDLKIDSLRIGRDNFQAATPMALGTRDPEKIAELGLDRIAEYTSVAILGAQTDGFTRSDNIIIVFYIDKDGRMIGYTVKLVGSE